LSGINDLLPLLGVIRNHKFCSLELSHAMSFDFPSRALYGVSVGVNAHFDVTVRPQNQIDNLTSILRDLIGAWMLTSYYARLTTDSTDIFYLLGEEAKGILLYHPDGYMSTTLLRPGQENCSMTDGAGLAEAAKRYLSYAGPFHLRLNGDVVVV